jgi:hypothetical protein
MIWSMNFESLPREKDEQQEKSGGLSEELNRLESQSDDECYKEGLEYLKEMLARGTDKLREQGKESNIAIFENSLRLDLDSLERLLGKGSRAMVADKNALLEYWKRNIGEGPESHSGE